MACELSKASPMKVVVTLYRRAKVEKSVNTRLGMRMTLWVDDSDEEIGRAHV